MVAFAPCSAGDGRGILAHMLFSPRIRTSQLAGLCRRLATALGAGIDVRTAWAREADRASGRAAREFRYRADISMIGVNIGIAAPMAFFPFGGAKGSFFGDLKAQGRDAISFYTDARVVISRW